MVLREDGCQYAESVLFDVQMTGEGGYEADVQDVDGGNVLRFEGHDASRFIARVVPEDLDCEASPDDAWSVGPDPAADTLEVRAEQAVPFTVFVVTGPRRVRRGHGPQRVQQVVRVQQSNGTGGWASLAETVGRQLCR